MKSITILSIILIFIGKINCGFFDGMNIGLTIPAMQLKVPVPPKIKVNAQVKMPPKPQSLKSLLPKFTYNIPTFGDDYHHQMEYASASNQQSVNILPNQKSNYHQNIQINDQLNNQLNNQLNDQLNNQLNDQLNSQLNNQMRNYQSNNQFNKYSNNQANIDLYGQSSNIRYPNYQQFNYPIIESRRLNDNFNRNQIQQRNQINQFNQIRSSRN